MQYLRQKPPLFEIKHLIFQRLSNYLKHFSVKNSLNTNNLDQYSIINLSDNVT